jgi:hypothetical protein
MPDGDERLDHVEQKLKDLGERIDERFAQVDQGFVHVDQRFDSLTVDVQKLRVLGEENVTQIKQIAELQVHHGSVLAEHGVVMKRLEEAIEPLKVLPVAVQSVITDHERRITALERRR